MPYSVAELDLISMRDNVQAADFAQMALECRVKKVRAELNAAEAAFYKAKDSSNSADCPKVAAALEKFKALLESSSELTQKWSDALEKKIALRKAYVKAKCEYEESNEPSEGGCSFCGQNYCDGDHSSEQRAISVEIEMSARFRLRPRNVHRAM